MAQRRSQVLIRRRSWTHPRPRFHRLGILRIVWQSNVSWITRLPPVSSTERDLWPSPSSTRDHRHTSRLITRLTYLSAQVWLRARPPRPICTLPSLCCRSRSWRNLRHARDTRERFEISGPNSTALTLTLQIEVVKCRAQVEQGSGAKLGSFKIASMIARREGLRGFYIGGLMTAIHDGISSGIFFWACESPFTFLFLCAAVWS